MIIHWKIEKPDATKYSNHVWGLVNCVVGRIWTLMGNQNLWSRNALVFCETCHIVIYFTTTIFTHCGLFFALVVNQEGQPLIEGKLKEKQVRWKFIKRWKTRYFTLAGNQLLFRRGKSVRSQ